MASSALKTKFTCPCCGYIVFDGPPGTGEICPICYWQDDPGSLRWAGTAMGPNRISLVEAQRNFAVYKASEERFRGYVRHPRADERLDPSWRPIDVRMDRLEQPTHEGSQTWPDDLEELYYWRTPE